MKRQKQTLVHYLENQGARTSQDIQAALKISQPTASRLLVAMSDEVIALGSGRSTRYAVAHPIGNAAAQQPIWRIGEDGQAQRMGLLSFLARSQIHIEAEGVNTLFEPTAQAELPWYLSPLRAQGFLGRLLAQGLSSYGLPSAPEKWDAHAVLLAALHTHDAPGSLLLGDESLKKSASPPLIPHKNPETALDAVSSDVAQTLPAGSSAGGEQAKFLAITESDEHILVKFSPPLGTPFGDRWSDLLYAEALCSEVLARHGHAVAPTRVVQTTRRTYLMSWRFDRMGRGGRTHVVALGAVHHAFVPGPYVHWASTCEALSRQGRLTASHAQSSAELLQFGRLIGNTDMHSGNASLRVQGATLAEIAKGKFLLAPVYDMLPMRWKPDPMLGLLDYEPFTPDGLLVSAQARAAAQDFWLSLSEHPKVSVSLRQVASAMATRMGV